MSSSTTLLRYISDVANRAVVRLRGTGDSTDSVFSGFFISPSGHLVTALHSVKVYVEADERTFELTLDRDAGPTTTGVESNGGATCITVRWQPEWLERHADWLVLKADHEPEAYLPVSSAGLHQGERYVAPAIVTYGFTVANSGPPHLTTLKGHCSRLLEDEHRYHVAHTVRSVGQSGGPAVLLSELAVIGSVIGYRRGEELTADIGMVDAQVLGTMSLGVDLAKLARDWRADAMRTLVRQDHSLALPAVSQVRPPLPARYLGGRPRVDALVDLLRRPDRSDVYLHGAAAAGKTVMALEVSATLEGQGVVSSAFWHDFKVSEATSLPLVARHLATHLVEHDGVYEPLEACLGDRQFAVDSEAVELICNAISGAAHVLVFDNMQELTGERAEPTLQFLSRLLHAARAGRSKIIFTSRRADLSALDSERVPVDGFTPDEVDHYLQLHQSVAFADDQIEYLKRHRRDLNVVRYYASSPESLAEAIADGPGGEPDAVKKHWNENLLAPLTPEEMKVLTALSVLTEGASHAELEEMSHVDRFAGVVHGLRANFAMLDYAGRRYSIHDNVKSAVLAWADRADVDAAHRAAMRHYEAAGDFLTAAHHGVSGHCPGGAVDVLFRHFEEVLAHAQVDDLTGFLDHSEGALSEPDRIYKYHALRASCAQVRGRFGEALNHWANSLTAAGQTTIDSLALHSRLGDTYRLASRYDEAADHYTTAMTLASDRRLRQTPASATRCERELGRAILGLAKLKRLRCAYPEALALYGRAAEVFEAFRDEYGLIEADFGLGEVQRLQSNWLPSFRSYRRSLERALAQGNRERYAYALWGIGEIHRLTGRLGWALATHAEGAEVCLKVGDMRSYGWAELGMAETHRMQGALDDALVHGTRALKEFSDAGSTTEVAHSKLSLAETRRLMAGRDQLGNLALDSYDEVLALYQGRGMEHCVVQAHLARAVALITLGRDAEAMHLLDQAEQMAAGHGLVDERSQARALRRPGAAPLVRLNFP